MSWKKILCISITSICFMHFNKRNIIWVERKFYNHFLNQPVHPVAYRVGGLVCSTPSEIPKALQNPAKLNPIVKTVNYCWI